MIPNWVDARERRARSRATTRGRASTGLTKRFVVMHSGNVGHAQDLDTLIRAATFLRDLDDLARRDHRLRRPPRRAASRSPRGSRPSKVRFLPYQPRELLLAVALVRRRPLRRARPRARRLRRPEPALRRPRGRPAGDRRGRRRERDRAARRARSAAASSSRRATRRARRARSALRTTASTTSPRWAGAARAYAEAEADRAIAIGRYEARALGAGAGRVIVVEVVFWASLAALVWTHAALSARGGRCSPASRRRPVAAEDGHAER